MDSINLIEKFKLFNDHWSPKIIAEINGQQIKLAKLKGDFVWHHHANEDELFFVISGCLEIQLKDKTITVNAGELYVVPKGVEHKPYAKEEVLLMLFEPSQIKHTGNVVSDLTIETCDYI